MNCYHCHSTDTTKAGKTVNQKQRFYCNGCRRFFRENPVLATKTKPYLVETATLPSRSQLILQLQAIAQDLGRTPTRKDIQQLSKQGKAFSRRVFYAVFGGFRAAITAARLPAIYNRRLDREQLLAELRELHRRQGCRPLATEDLRAGRRRGEISPLNHFKQVFGSLPAAVREIGAARRHDYTRAELIKELRELARALERMPRKKDIDRCYEKGTGAHYKKFINEFGSFREARLIAGVEMSGGRQPQKAKLERAANQGAAIN